MANSMTEKSHSVCSATCMELNEVEAVSMGDFAGFNPVKCEEVAHAGAGDHPGGPARKCLLLGQPSCHLNAAVWEAGDFTGCM